MDAFLLPWVYGALVRSLREVLSPPWRCVESQIGTSETVQAPPVWPVPFPHHLAVTWIHNVRHSVKYLFIQTCSY